MRLDGASGRAHLMVHIQNCAETADWSRIERDYVAGVRPVIEIANEAGMPVGVLVREVRRRGWPLRTGKKKAGSRHGLAARLKKLIEAEIEDIEGQELGERNAADRERDARRLSSLLGSLGKLFEIERDQSKGKKTPVRKGEGDAFIQELERRLARIAAAGHPAEIPEEPQPA
ncbi:MAG: hypothetical protein PW790_09310 [Parvibaculaceae bacterium]|nr:hypothetical protein [Parvibaculaceae bacterium]